MFRTTIMLPGNLKQQAEEKARSMGVSLGQLIRKSLQVMLTQGENAKGKNKKVRDPLFSDSAVYKGETPRNLSRNHDDFLYGENR